MAIPAKRYKLPSGVFRHTTAFLLLLFLSAGTMLLAGTAAAQSDRALPVLGMEILSEPSTSTGEENIPIPIAYYRQGVGTSNQLFSELSIPVGITTFGDLVLVASLGGFTTLQQSLFSSLSVYRAEGGAGENVAERSLNLVQHITATVENGLIGAIEIAASEESNLVFVTAQGINALSVWRATVDASTPLEFVAVYQEGLSRPQGIAVSSSLVFVAGRGDDTLSVWRIVDAEGSEPLQQVKVYKDNQEGIDGLADPLAVAARGDLVFVAGWRENALSIWQIVDAEGDTPLQQVAVYTQDEGGFTGLAGPRAIAVHPTEDWVYVASRSSNLQEEVSALSVLQILRAPAEQPDDMATPSLAQLETQQADDESLGDDRALLRPASIAVSAEGDRIYLASGSRVNPGTNEIIKDGSLSAWLVSDDGSLQLETVRFEGESGVDDLEGNSRVAVGTSPALVFATGSGSDAVTAWNSVGSGEDALVEVTLRPRRSGYIAGLWQARNVAAAAEMVFITQGGRGRHSLGLWYPGPAGPDAPLELVELHLDGVLGIDGLQGAAGIAVSPDARLVFVAARVDNALSAWRVTNVAGRPSLRQFALYKDGEGGIDFLEGATDVALSPGGDLLFVVSAAADNFGTLSTWGVGSDALGAPVLTQHMVYRHGDDDGGDMYELADAFAIAVSPVKDDNLLFVAGRANNTLSVWRIDSQSSTAGALTQVAVYRDCPLPPDMVACHDGLAAPHDIVVSPDGQLVFIAAREDDAISVWRVNASAVGSSVLQQVAVYQQDAFATIRITRPSTTSVTTVESERVLIRPAKLAIAPDGSQLFVVNTFANLSQLHAHSFSRWSINQVQDLNADVPLELNQPEESGQPAAFYDGLRRSELYASVDWVTGRLRDITFSPDGSRIFMVGTRSFSTWREGLPRLPDLGREIVIRLSVSRILDTTATVTLQAQNHSGINLATLVRYEDVAQFDFPPGITSITLSFGLPQLTRTSVNSRYFTLRAAISSRDTLSSEDTLPIALAIANVEERQSRQVTGILVNSISIVTLLAGPEEFKITATLDEALPISAAAVVAELLVARTEFDADEPDAADYMKAADFSVSAGTHESLQTVYAFASTGIYYFLLREPGEKIDLLEEQDVSAGPIQAVEQLRVAAITTSPSDSAAVGQAIKISASFMSDQVLLLHPTTTAQLLVARTDIGAAEPSSASFMPAADAVLSPGESEDGNMQLQGSYTPLSVGDYYFRLREPPGQNLFADEDMVQSEAVRVTLAEVASISVTNGARLVSRPIEVVAAFTGITGPFAASATAQLLVARTEFDADEPDSASFMPVADVVLSPGESEDGNIQLQGSYTPLSAGDYYFRLGEPPGQNLFANEDMVQSGAVPVTLFSIDTIRPSPTAAVIGQLIKISASFMDDQGLALPPATTAQLLVARTGFDFAAPSSASFMPVAGGVLVPGEGDDSMQLQGSYTPLSTGDYYFRLGEPPGQNLIANEDMVQSGAVPVMLFSIDSIMPSTTAAVIDQLIKISVSFMGDQGLALPPATTAQLLVARTEFDAAAPSSASFMPVAGGVLVPGEGDDNMQLQGSYTSASTGTYYFRLREPPGQNLFANEDIVQSGAVPVMLFSIDSIMPSTTAAVIDQLIKISVSFMGDQGLALPPATTAQLLVARTEFDAAAPSSASFMSVAGGVLVPGEGDDNMQLQGSYTSASTGTYYFRLEEPSGQNQIANEDEDAVVSMPLRVDSHLQIEQIIAAALPVTASGDDIEITVRFGTPLSMLVSEIEADLLVARTDYDAPAPTTRAVFTAAASVLSRQGDILRGTYAAMSSGTYYFALRERSGQDIIGNDLEIMSDGVRVGPPRITRITASPAVAAVASEVQISVEFNVPLVVSAMGATLHLLVARVAFGNPAPEVEVFASATSPVIVLPAGTYPQLQITYVLPFEAGDYYFRLGEPPGQNVLPNEEQATTATSAIVQVNLLEVLSISAAPSNAVILQPIEVTVALSSTITVTQAVTVAHLLRAFVEVDRPLAGAPFLRAVSADIRIEPGTYRQLSVTYRSERSGDIYFNIAEPGAQDIFANEGAPDIVSAPVRVRALQLLSLAVTPTVTFPGQEVAIIVTLQSTEDRTAENAEIILRRLQEARTEFEAPVPEAATFTAFTGAVSLASTGTRTELRYSYVPLSTGTYYFRIAELAEQDIFIGEDAIEEASLRVDMFLDLVTPAGVVNADDLIFFLRYLRLCILANDACPADTLDSTSTLQTNLDAGLLPEAETRLDGLQNHPSLTTANGLVNIASILQYLNDIRDADLLFPDDSFAEDLSPAERDAERQRRLRSIRAIINGSSSPP